METYRCQKIWLWRQRTPVRSYGLWGRYWGWDWSDWQLLGAEENWTTCVFLRANFSNILRKIDNAQSNRYAFWCTTLTASTDARTSTNSLITGTKLNKHFFSLVCRSVGTLKSDDGDGNENIKEAIGWLLRFSFVVAYLGDIRDICYGNVIPFLL